VRVLKQTFLEGFLGPARRRAHYAGKQANASVEKRDRGGLAARQDNVAERDFLDRAARTRNANFPEASDLIRLCDLDCRLASVTCGLHREAIPRPMV